MEASRVDLTRNKLIISTPFFSYLLYVIFVWLCDVADFICYLAGINQATLVSRILMLIIVVFVAMNAKSHFLIKYIKKEKIFYLILAVLFLYAILISAVPNSEGDSWGTHFPNIFPGFYDNVNDYVFDKGIGSFMFPLNDRLFYYPFLLFGYRLSSLLNFMVIAISYEIIVEILKLLAITKNEGSTKDVTHSIKPNHFGIVNLLQPEFFGLIIIGTFYIMANIGVYMVDMIAVPFLLEMLRIDVDCLQKKETYKPTTFELIYYAVVTGLVIAMKLTNVIFAIPLLILFLMINRRSIKALIFFTCVAIGMLPMLPYLAYSYLSTGNPLFPFYNAIFQSPYWGDVNFKDGRWGPQTLLQSIFWPVQSIIHPSQRLSEMAPIGQCSIFLGCIASAIIFIKRKIHSNSVHNALIVIFFVQTYLWIFTTGYGRYEIFAEILAGMIVYCALIRTEQLRTRLLSIVLILAILLQSVFTAGQVIYSGKGWSGKPSILQQPSYYIENLPMLLRDRGLIGTETQREKVDYFIQLNYFCTLDRLLNPEAKEINLTYLHHPGFTIDKINPNYVQEQTDRIKKHQIEGKGIYSVIPNNHYHIIADLANNANAYIYDIEYLPSYFEPYYYMLLVKTGIEEGKKNELIYASNPSREFHIKNTDNKVHIKGIVAITAEIAKNYGTTLFEIEAIDSKQSKIIYRQEVNPLNFYNLNVELDLSDMEENVQIVFKHKYLDGTNIADAHLTILNPEIFEEI